MDGATRDRRWLVMGCPGYDAANVRPMSDEAHTRLTAEGTARAYHLADAHPHLFCGCGNETKHCHPGRCCTDGDWGQCMNCGKPAPEPEPIPEAELSDGLWAEVES